MASLMMSVSLFCPSSVEAKNSAIKHVATMDTVFYADEDMIQFTNEIKSSRLFYGIKVYKCTTTRYSDGRVTNKYAISYRMTKKQAKTVTAKEKAIAKKAMKKGRKKDRDLKYIYDAVRNVKYHQNSPLDYTPYGDLVRKKSSCEGISLAFYDICQYAGRSVRIVKCKANGTAHMLVSVKTGKKWYYYDPTWDIGHKKTSYFKKSKAYMQKKKHVF